MCKETIARHIAGFKNNFFDARAILTITHNLQVTLNQTPKIVYFLIKTTANEQRLLEQFFLRGFTPFHIVSK